MYVSRRTAKTVKWKLCTLVILAGEPCHDTSMSSQVPLLRRLTQPHRSPMSSRLLRSWITEALASSLSSKPFAGVQDSLERGIAILQQRAPGDDSRQSLRRLSETNQAWYAHFRPESVDEPRIVIVNADVDAPG
jgi:hypothetical protein